MSRFKTHGDRHLDLSPNFSLEFVGRPMRYDTGHVVVAVLSGPTFAKEVGAGLPTAMTIASNDADFARHLAEAISSDNFRAYTSDERDRIRAASPTIAITSTCAPAARCSRRRPSLPTRS